MLGRLPWPWLKRWWGTHHLHACSVIANRVIFSRKHGPVIAVLSLLVHVLAVVIAWCVVQSIAAPVVFGQIFQLVPPVMLITMLPISIAGWGVREATMGLAFGYAGLMANEGVNVSLLFGAVILHRRRLRRAGLDFQRREGRARLGADRGSGVTAALDRMTNSGLLLSIFAVAAASLVSAAITWAIRPLLLRHALARPNARSSHRVPTPQGAGIAVIAATLLIAEMVAVYADPVRGAYPCRGVRRDAVHRDRGICR